MQLYEDIVSIPQGNSARVRCASAFRYGGGSVRRIEEGEHHRFHLFCAEFHRCHQRYAGQCTLRIEQFVYQSRDSGAARHVQPAGGILFGA